MIIESNLQTVFNLVDTFFVSKISYSAIGALVSSSMLLMLISTLTIGISIASSIFFTQSWGAKNYKRASIVYSNALIVMVAFSIASIMLYPFLDNILSLLGLKDSTLVFAKEFLSVSILGLPISFAFGLNSSTLKSMSLPNKTLIIMLVATIINIALDPLFIFVLKMGVKGAALATICSMFVGILLQIYVISKTKLRFRLNINIQLIKQLLSKSIFASFHLMIRILSMILIIKIIAIHSQVAISSYSIVTRIYQILLFMIFGISNAAAVIVGQNIGSKNWSFVKEGVEKSLLFGTAFISFLDILLFLFSGSIIGIFTSQNQCFEISKNAMVYFALSYPFFAMGSIANRITMACGNTFLPSIMNFFSLFLFQLPLAYFLSIYISLNGVWLSILLANILNFLLNIIILKYNLSKLSVDYKFLMMFTGQRNA
ncbi:Multi antimicrobial extrusion protein (Na(+)/drug antiporter) [Desulfurella amilsii]|uniref:Multidrug-efflux transporter n=1 Tax=Desulfurella amilsii TaxID=1562698 RepID=A0A1X4XX50_9BACT|nr:MATE family efflux transporter [Desulfurella amilsii]OSS42094.1 Multi antimicrobial extrusion protein (Na(+)/drug antiporter) [Desulfurella amilsii]